MNALPSAMLSLFAATATALAADQQVEIQARYEGFPPVYLKSADAKKSLPRGVLAAPKVTVKVGNTAVVEIADQVLLPVAGDGKAPDPQINVQTTSTDAHGNTHINGRKTENCGVTLEVSPELKGGKLFLSGKSTVRQRLEPGAQQPLRAMSFASRETYFSDEIANGQTVRIRVGDGPKDNATIVLTAKLSTKVEAIKK
jgi:hypothetical protein